MLLPRDVGGGANPAGRGANRAGPGQRQLAPKRQIGNRTEAVLELAALGAQRQAERCPQGGRDAIN